MSQNDQHSEFRFLDGNQLDQIYEIEQKVYPEPWSRNLMYESLEAPMTHAKGLFLDQVGLVGYGIYQVVFSEGHLLNIAVDPQWQRKGFGEKLLFELMNDVKGRGGSSFFLEVRPSNEPARKMYEKNGFRSLMVREKYYSDGEAALIMVKDL